MRGNRHRTGRVVRGRLAAGRHTDWISILARSLTWVTARRGTRLVGFVNVATDGGVHAFLLDTTVHPDEQRNGLGTRLVRAAADAARRSGAGWLHVDYEPHLSGFYRSCGFRPTGAALLDLTPLAQLHPDPVVRDLHPADPPGEADACGHQEDGDREV